MLKIKHKLLSSMIIAAPLFLNTGIAATVHASTINNKTCAAYNTACKSIKSNNCVTTNGANYNCSKLIQSLCNGSVYNCKK
ncbi:MAG: hypothetical protein LKE46_16905 [Clostridium sp.]|jgi:hypothetical protein|uniref:hypothetical protein n=1 Tax=Clostridium sp. TaxID=1506 RepID=UPI0025C701D9|nr:hypothetical protein [Clostridium sp.]MCH3965896.1 hypothetical protein [Clostridium sp.]MCI1716015.1 hypothetical protein [Clostridium sp.]MCI1800313.1 hypothetical protein [Clostridium sp.]MCI1814192.1 hypothetical protein [Clostridium sp.]MCI1871091.1 hypothetical protein [Clostridium sp.]